MTSNFYRALEEKFRGSRSFVKSRLEIYLPFILPLLTIYPQAQTIDLGCGRGEWLELLNENGFIASGVDLNQDMLEPAREAGFQVHLGDAISFLKQLPDQSQVVVSSFHLVEHLSFNEVEILVQESLRVLRPGGILIIETPNPENLSVGTASFYLDPTHKNPIPPNLLALLPEHYGFKKIKLLRLQENLSILDRKIIGLSEVLHGVSPDCAIVAQKEAEEEILCLNENAFEKNYGLTLEEITAKYDKQYKNLLSDVGSIINLFLKFEFSRLNFDKEFKALSLIIKNSEFQQTAQAYQIEKLTSLLQKSEAGSSGYEKQIEILAQLLQDSESERLEKMEKIKAITNKVLATDSVDCEHYSQLRLLIASLEESEQEVAKRLELIEDLRFKAKLLHCNKRPGWKAYLPKFVFSFLKKCLYLKKYRQITRKFNDLN